MLDLLTQIYKDSEIAEKTASNIDRLLEQYREKLIKKRKENWDQHDVFLITYADQFQEDSENSLVSFSKFYDNYLMDIFEIVHFLPFYPYTSDDGFSVVDYKQVNPKAGTWEDIDKINQKVRLMFDFVCNHMSSQSAWFQEYLALNPEYKDFFIEVEPRADLSAVIRPRTTPLLTEFNDKEGTKRHIWTTFSADQIDLNFGNPAVLLKMIDILLFYIEKGASFIRLDAVGFLWKEIGTTCMHLPETHSVIQLFRKIVDSVAPGTVLITETNVPHKDNISYFGDGYNEAQMVYQFPLPPLILYAVRSGNTAYLKQWAGDLDFSYGNTTFFNFLASHDGIGLNPIRGIVPEEEILSMVQEITADGGLVNNKQNPDGSFSPYEINATYLDALSRQADDDALRISRFLLAHSVLLTLPGVPAIYIQSVLGSRNDYEGVAATGENRAINRQKFPYSQICREMTDSQSLRRQIYEGIKEMSLVRKNESVFHPDATMTVLPSSDDVFAFSRTYESQEAVLLHNFAPEPVGVLLEKGRYTDLINSDVIVADGVSEIRLKPYGYLWLKK